MTVRKTHRPGLIAVLLAGLAACAPITATRGNLVEQERLDRLEPGRSTAEDVVRILGSPSMVGTFEDDIWYYVGTITEQRAFFRPEVSQQRVVAISFDADDVVLAIRDIDQAEARSISIVDAKTPTGGRKLGFFEQLFGNLGGGN